MAALLADHLAEVRWRIAALHAAEADLVELLRRAERVEPSSCAPKEVCEILAEPLVATGRP